MAIRNSAPRSPIRSYFIFFQKQGRWAWQRVDERDNVIQQSRSTFMLKGLFPLSPDPNRERCCHATESCTE
jgi:hypothetical protein